MICVDMVGLVWGGVGQSNLCWQEGVFVGRVSWLIYLYLSHLQLGKKQKSETPNLKTFWASKSPDELKKNPPPKKNGVEVSVATSTFELYSV